MSSIDRWAIAEVMGHQRHVGRISEETIAGVPMLRVDQPRGDEYVTTYLAGSSLFRLTPCTEAVARGDWSNRASAPAAIGSGSIVDAHLEDDDEWVCDTPGCDEPTEEDEPLCGLCLDNCLDIAGRCVDPDCTASNPIPHAVGGTTKCVSYDPDDERSPRSQIESRRAAAATGRDAEGRAVSWRGEPLVRPCSKCARDEAETGSTQCFTCNNPF